MMTLFLSVMWQAMPIHPELHLTFDQVADTFRKDFNEQYPIPTSTPGLPPLIIPPMEAPGLAGQVAANELLPVKQKSLSSESEKIRLALTKR
jgi:hypothetical protein